MTTDKEIYIGIKKCGCVTRAVMKGLDGEEEDLKQWEKEGYKIELTNITIARKRISPCKHRTKGEFANLGDKSTLKSQELRKRNPYKLTLGLPNFERGKHWGYEKACDELEKMEKE